MITPLRVLMVEDESSDADLVQMQLQEDGFEPAIVRVETEQELLIAMHDEHDIILSDWRLPHFSGARALQLRKTIRPTMPFVVVSGRIGEEAAIALIRDGAEDYVLKDNLTRLGIVVRRVLEDARHRRVQEAAAETIGLQLTALEATAHGIVITDRSGSVEWVNTAFCTLTGYSPQEVLRRNPGELVRSGHHAAGFYKDMWDTILAGRVWRGEMRNRRKDGTLYDEEQTITPVRDRAGRISHFISIKLDVSERHQREKELAAIARVCSALRRATTRASMLPIVLDEVTDLFDATGAAILIQAGDGLDDGIMVARGELVGAVEGEAFPFPAGAGMVNDGQLAVAALQVHEATIGTIAVCRRIPLGDSERRVLRSVADIAANAIERERRHEEAVRAARELAAAYETTIEGWSHALDLRDHETEGHTQRVTELTMRLARAAAIPDADLQHVRRGALLHDIGKMGVPDGVLLKPGRLTEDEWVIMRMHPQFAWDLLHPIEFLRPALDIPFCHHERWDGTGYPRGLKGEDIPLAARLFAVVDVWDALRSNRPYRPGWSVEETLAHIRRGSGTHFDPAAVDQFMVLMHHEGEARGVTP